MNKTKVISKFGQLNWNKHCYLQFDNDISFYNRDVCACSNDSCSCYDAGNDIVCTDSDDASYALSVQM